MSEISFDYVFKVVIVGDCCVGKSSLFKRVVDDLFDRQYNTTIGIDFSLKHYNIDGTQVKIQIWDTAGQERFKAITKSYYRGANAVIIVYDITKIESFMNVKKWIEDLKGVSLNNVKICLIGNKADLVSQRVISVENGLEVARYNNALFFETSALTGDNVHEFFLYLVKELLYGRISHEKTLESDNAKEQTNFLSIPITNPFSSQPKTKSCC